MTTSKQRLTIAGFLALLALVGGQLYFKTQDVFVAPVASATSAKAPSSGALGATAVATVAAAEGSGSKGTRAVSAGGSVLIRPITEDGTLGDAVEVPKLDLDERAWQEKLTKSQYNVLRQKGTERAFTGSLLKNKAKGLYTCAGCNLALFSSESKFKSGTGWPSFFEPVTPENVAVEEDRAHGMVRTEILCARCDGHLGHVFKDGPKPTGLRYCLNSEAMQFTEESNLQSLAEEITVAAASPASISSGKWLPHATKDVPLQSESSEAKAIFGGGCFWCTEAVFESLEGVTSVVSGYAGGDPKLANYKAVCTGRSGHAEVIQINYDPSKISYGSLMRVFFTTHDPTTLNYQKPDRGPQYRSSIFYQSDAEKALAAAYIEELNASGKFSDPIVTTLEPLETFFPAEDYHQDFVKLNPNHGYVRSWALPKLEKLDKMLKADKSEA
jgi:peptide methionine sulfoxide reductase msrA/msrB